MVIAWIFIISLIILDMRIEHIRVNEQLKRRNDGR